MTDSSIPTNPNEPFEAEPVGFPAAVDAENLAARQSIEVVVTRFMDEARDGLTPSIEDYARKHPELADELRELLPLVESLEQWGVDKEVECVRGNIPDDFSLSVVGDYRIVREIGRGGMGVVFEAAHIETHKHVAIKLLPYRYVADLPRRREHLRREATTIAGLRHCNIVPVYSFGSYRGYRYYVMQLVEGVNLDTVIKRLRESREPVCISDLAPASAGAAQRESFRLERDSWKAFAKIMVQVAQGLAHAHKHDVLHNDIKPGNLLLDRSGLVIVTDFGVDLPDEMSGEGDHPPGTLRYMAPERFSGKSTARSDIYAIGVTLYELLTRTPAFQSADREQLIEQVLQSTPLRPRELNPEVPLALEMITLKAMAKRPEDRFGSADELHAELLRFINDRRIKTRRPGVFGRLMNWLRR